jgi:hypothetical protein
MSLKGKQNEYYVREGTEEVIKKMSHILGETEITRHNS